MTDPHVQELLDAAAACRKVLDSPSFDLLPETADRLVKAAETIGQEWRSIIDVETNDRLDRLLGDRY